MGLVGFAASAVVRLRDEIGFLRLLAVRRLHQDHVERGQARRRFFELEREPEREHGMRDDREQQGHAEAVGAAVG